MNSNYSFKVRALAFFLAAQFLNVQIQTSFATEAVTTHSPEAQAALQQVENRVANKLAHKSEKAALKIAYKLYKINLKLRNKTVQNASEEQTQLSAEELTTLNEVTPVDQDQNNALPTAPAVSKEEAKKEKVIARTDPALKALGSELQSDGLLSQASFEDFQKSIEQLPVKNSLRSPSSAVTTIVKIIVSLLIILAGYAIIYTIVLMTILYAWAGVTLVGWLIVLMVAGVAVAAVLGIIALWSSDDLKLITQTQTRC